MSRLGTTDPVRRMKNRREEMRGIHRDYRNAAAAGRIGDADRLKAQFARKAANLRRLGKAEAARRKARAAAAPAGTEKARQSAANFRVMAEAMRKMGKHEMADDYVKFAMKWERVASGHKVSFAGGEAG